MPADPSARRRSRFWLYAPFALLGLVAAGWSVLWHVARGKVEQQLDAGVAREAAAGRSWTCADRSIGGYPFRLEVRCASLGLVSSRWGDEVSLKVGPAVLVAQAWAPGHVILQATGPLAATLPGGASADTSWSLFEASLKLKMDGFERLSLVIDQPVTTLRRPGQPDEVLRSQAFEAHLRPNPQRFAGETAVDLAIETKGTVLPVLDQLLADATPADLDIQATVSQVPAFRRGFNPDALESWRQAAGDVTVSRLSLRKGAIRVEAAGRGGLDDMHRPAGNLDASIAGVERIGGIKVGGLTAGLGAIFGGRQPAGDASGLTPLPPVVLREGRVFLGPIRLPLQPVAPLY